MPKITVLVGIPGSGKTTWAKEQVKKSNGQTKRINRDSLRDMIDSDWSKDKEKFIRDARNALIITALNGGFDVIVDDTNLVSGQVEELKRLFSTPDWVDLGVQIETKSFLDVPVEECIRRDALRPNPVGEQVIRNMAKLIKKDKPRSDIKHPPAPDWATDPSLPPCIICDIDGTIAINNSGRSPFDWGRVGEDDVRWPVLETVLRTASTYPDSVIFFTSGREDVCRSITENWLDRSVGKSSAASRNMWPHFALLMRKSGDRRDDGIVKQELVEQHIKGKYRIEAVFDDRPKVCRKWQEMGLWDRLFQVGTGEEF